MRGGELISLRKDDGVSPPYRTRVQVEKQKLEVAQPRIKNKSELPISE